MKSTNHSSLPDQAMVRGETRLGRLRRDRAALLITLALVVELCGAAIVGGWSWAALPSGPESLPPLDLALRIVPLGIAILSGLLALGGVVLCAASRRWLLVCVWLAFHLSAPLALLAPTALGRVFPGFLVFGMAQGVTLVLWMALVAIALSAAGRRRLALLGLFAMSLGRFATIIPVVVLYPGFPGWEFFLVPIGGCWVVLAVAALWPITRRPVSAAHRDAAAELGQPAGGPNGASVTAGYQGQSLPTAAVPVPISVNGTVRPAPKWLAVVGAVSGALGFLPLPGGVIGAILLDSNAGSFLFLTLGTVGLLALSGLAVVLGAIAGKGGQARAVKRWAKTAVILGAVSLGIECPIALALWMLFWSLSQPGAGR